MTLILSGQFDDFEHAARVVSDLRSLGIAGDQIETFALNAPGQHDRFPGGGDEDADREAEKGDEGAMGGAALGGAAGLALGAAAIPIVGPLAAAAGVAVGAYTGSLAGAVKTMGAEDQDAAVPPTPRPAGVRVSVSVPAPDRRAGIVDTFTRHHAHSIEEAEGTWRNGSWVDFDPVSVPRWVLPPAR
jgi:hypothetical protein